MLKNESVVVYYIRKENVCIRMWFLVCIQEDRIFKRKKMRIDIFAILMSK